METRMGPRSEVRHRWHSSPIEYLLWSVVVWVLGYSCASILFSIWEKIISLST